MLAEEEKRKERWRGGRRSPTYILGGYMLAGHRPYGGYPAMGRGRHAVARVVNLPGTPSPSPLPSERGQPSCGRALAMDISARRAGLARTNGSIAAIDEGRANKRSSPNGALWMVHLRINITQL